MGLAFFPSDKVVLTDSTVYSFHPEILAYLGTILKQKGKYIWTKYY